MCSKHLVLNVCLSQPVCFVFTLLSHHTENNLLPNTHVKEFVFLTET